MAREHDHFTITRNGRADVMLISVVEYESMQETLDILGDEETQGRPTALPRGLRRRQMFTAPSRLRAGA